MALKARHRARRKGGPGERVFGCDLLEHLRQTGQEVPQVLRSCTEFVEQHGVVDGIYRLSGVASNIQRLRQEFDSDRDPDLSRPTYLQDIHCVSSLCKAYCRELPNPLLTFQLYHRFADAVATQTEEARLVKIKEVLKELPLPHYRTLEFLMRHLLRMAAHSSRTNMHARNLAIVWAPNLLRSRDIEATGFNGTAAFMEVRVQSIVVEFILTHVEQLFGDAPLHGDTVSPRRSLLLTPLGHVPATLSQGDGPPPIRPYHTIIELGDHRRKGSLKAKKWRSIFNLGRSSHEAKRKLVKAEEKGDKCGKPSLRPAKSMDSLSCDPFASDEHPGLSQTRSVKQPQRRESFGTCPVPDQSPEPPGGTEPTRDPEGERGASSEPTTPRGGRAAPLPPGRSPKAGSRAEKCLGLHISGPFSVTVPFHITSNLSRLTRGLPCPALAQPPASPPPKDPQNGAGEKPLPGISGCWGEPWDEPPPCPRAGRDTEQRRLSLELRDSFAFLDSQEPWLEGAGDGEGSLSLLSDTGDSERSLAMEEGMESGFMNPGEPPTEQPPSYLSIEECMDEEMFFMAPSGSDPEDRAGDTDSDDMFLSAHDDLSPLVASLEPPEQPPREGTATAPPDPPSAPSTSGEQDRSAALGPAGPCPTDEEAPGDGEPLGGALAEWGAPGTGEGAVGNGSVRTDSSSEDGPEGEAGETGSREGAGPVPSKSDGAVEEDGAASSAPEEPGEGEPQPAPGSLPASSLEETPGEPAEPPDPEVAPDEAPKEPAEPPDPEVAPDEAPKEPVEPPDPEVSPKEVPEEPVEPPDPEVSPKEAPEEPAEPPDPEVAPEEPPRLVLPAMASLESSRAAPGSSSGPPSLSASAPDLRSASPEAPEPPRAGPRGAAGRPEPALRQDGSAPARLAARAVRLQQARSVPVVPPKPQFARIPPAPQPWGLPAADGEAAAPPPGPPEGSPRRAGWRAGGSASFDAAVAAEQQPPPAPVRRIQTYGGGEAVPAAPRALPFQRAPLRPRLPRPLSCAAAPEGRGPAGSRRGLGRPGQDEGAALAAARRAVGAEGAVGER